MKNAFNYMFKDNMFKQKALACFGFMFIAQCFIQWASLYMPEVKGALPPVQYYILFFLGYFLMFIPTGYGISCLKALMEQKENPVLPFVNIKNNFILGFKITVSVTLFVLAFIGICLIVTGISLIPVVAIKLIASILIILLGLLAIPLFLAFVVYYPALYTIFAKKEWWTTFFRYIKATKLIGEGAGTYFKGLGLIILIAIVTTIIAGLFGGILGFLFGQSIIVTLLVALITALINTYIVYVYAYITLKAVKHESI